MYFKKIELIFFSLFIISAGVSIFMKLPAFKFDNDLAMSLSTCLPQEKEDKFFDDFYAKFENTVLPGTQKDLYKTYIKASIYLNYPIQAICLLFYKFKPEDNFISQIWKLIDAICYLSFIIFVFACILFYQNKNFRSSCYIFFLLCILIPIKNNEKYFSLLDQNKISQIIFCLIIALCISFFFKKQYNNIIKTKIHLEKLVLISFVIIVFLLNFFLVKNPLIYLLLTLVPLFYLKSSNITESLLLGGAISLCFNQWLLWMNFIPVGRGFLFLLATFLVPMAILTRKRLYAYLLPILLIFHLHVGLLVLIVIALYECINLRFKSTTNLVCLISATFVIIFTKNFHYGWLPIDAIAAIKLLSQKLILDKGFVIANLLILVFFVFGITNLKDKKEFFPIFCSLIGAFLITFECCLAKYGIDRYSAGLGKLVLIPLYLCPFLFTASLIFVLIQNQEMLLNLNTKGINLYLLNIALIFAVYIFCQNPYELTKFLPNTHFENSFNNNCQKLNEQKFYLIPGATATDPNIWYNFLRYKINKHKLKNSKFNIEIK